MLPFGAPVDFPPCNRQRPLDIAGARHEFARLVRAPHRDARCMGKSVRVGGCVDWIKVKCASWRDANKGRWRLFEKAR